MSLQQLYYPIYQYAPSHHTGTVYEPDPYPAIVAPKFPDADIWESLTKALAPAAEEFAVGNVLTV